MLHIRPKLKPVMLLIPVGLGIALIVLLGLALSAGRPVQAQPPLDEAYPPELMLMEPRAIDQDPRLKVSVNYAFDIIEEAYPEGFTIYLTVTNPAGDVKATAQLVTGEVPHWGPGQYGFSTAVGNPWVPAKPDIRPGDRVQATSSDGYAASVRVGDIQAAIDVAAGTVSGTIDAPDVMTEGDGDVDVKCRAYDPVTGDFKDVFVLPAGGTIPNGADVFSCNFAAEGWTLAPGQFVAISYDPLGPEIRSNRILNYLRVPGPYLQIKTWAAGAAGLDGNMVLNVEYRNQGTRPATGVQITGNLVGLSFLESTYADAPSGGGTGPIVWDLGTVEPDDRWSSFQVFVRVTGGVPSTASATMQITSVPPENMGAPGERTSTWSGMVQDNGAWFTISKDAWTHHPVPGTEFVYTLHVCNAVSEYAVDSSTATVTDTLPSAATLVSWWPAEEGWSEVSRTGNQLVLSRPSIAAHGCTEVYIRAALAPGLSEGAQLCNEAIVTADNHTVNTANQTTWCHSVGAPQPNLSINKEWACGSLVPGGELVYNIMVHNTGNMPISGPIMITDTLPPGTSFNSARFYENQPFEFNLVPVSASANQVVWQVNGIDNGYWTKFKIELDIDENVEPGTQMENVIAIGKAGLVERYTTDNVASWRELIYPPGPNMRVVKQGSWDNWGEATRRISYGLDVENVGDQIVYDVVLTDTYDSRLTRDGAVRIDPGINFQFLTPKVTHQFVVKFDQIAPGQNVGVDFGALASGGPVEPGLTFVNTAEVTLIETDTEPADNVAVTVHTSGPDLAITKNFLGGLIEAGEVITYSLTFGNARGTNVWWWGLKGDAVITEALPGGMAFVRSQLCNVEGRDCVAVNPTTNTGDTVTWNVGKLATGTWRILKVAARLPEGAARGTAFTNHVQIASTDPVQDAEADLTNNAANVTVRIGVQSPLNVMVYMPLITRNTAP
jgi:uncharacterized repeat protein (TIGR01451 family)